VKIGQVAKETGVSVQTIRLYEQKGLIPTAQRTESGYREYPLSVLDDVRAVKQGQRLGFTLTEMKEFVNLQQSPVKSHESLAAFIQQKYAQLNERIAQMMELRDALMTLSVDSYDWNVAGDCPITRLLADIHEKHKEKAERR
jgi:DNA-binding transcriptional MerR regulator